MKKICFVAMPFGAGNEYDGKKEESDFIFKSIITPAVAQAVLDFTKQFGDQFEHQIEMVRELENVTPGNITESIIRHLADSYITIVDLTGKNPNVFFELGVRFALRRNGTILLVQDTNQIPFNVRNFRVVEYRPKYSGIDKAIDALKLTVFKTLQVLAGPVPTTTDSLVFQALHELKITGLGFTEEAPETEKISWDEYWTKVAYVVDTLNQLRSTGVYEPDIIIGISNGGLFLADTILRLVYGNKLPLLSLWALRRQERYFDNPVNNALINKNLISSLTDGKNGDKSTIRILIMDDIVGTQRTFNQLEDYLKQRLEDVFYRLKVNFVFLFSPRQDTISDLAKYLLSSDPEIISKFKKVELETITKKSDLPYLKSIHYGDITKPETSIKISSPHKNENSENVTNQANSADTKSHETG